MKEVQAVLLTIEEAARAMRLSRTKVYELLSNGSLPSVYIGRSRRISVQAIHDYVQKNESTVAA